MATIDAGQSGMPTLGTPQAGPPQPPIASATFSFVAGGSLTYYKMQGKCSIHTWDNWVNLTGDETGREVHGVQETGTIVATRRVAQGT